MKVCGTTVSVYQQCNHCGQTFTWHSQLPVLGRLPAGNILLSFLTLLAGTSISKILLTFRHMGLAVYSGRAFFKHQAKFFPSDIETLGNIQGIFNRKRRMFTECFLVW